MPGESPPTSIQPDKSMDIDSTLSSYDLSNHSNNLAPSNFAEELLPSGPDDDQRGSIADTSATAILDVLSDSTKGNGLKRKRRRKHNRGAKNIALRASDAGTAPRSELIGRENFVGDDGDDHPLKIDHASTPVITLSRQTSVGPLMGRSKFKHDNGTYKADGSSGRNFYPIPPLSSAPNNYYYPCCCYCSQCEVTYGSGPYYGAASGGPQPYGRPNSRWNTVAPSSFYYRGGGRGRGHRKRKFSDRFNTEKVTFPIPSPNAHDGTNKFDRSPEPACPEGDIPSQDGVGVNAGGEEGSSAAYTKRCLEIDFGAVDLDDDGQRPNLPVPSSTTDGNHLSEHREKRLRSDPYSKIEKASHGPTSIKPLPPLMTKDYFFRQSTRPPIYGYQRPSKGRNPQPLSKSPAGDETMTHGTRPNLKLDRKGRPRFFSTGNLSKSSPLSTYPRSSHYQYPHDHHHSFHHHYAHSNQPGARYYNGNHLAHHHDHHNNRNYRYNRPQQRYKKMGAHPPRYQLRQRPGPKGPLAQAPSNNSNQRRVNKQKSLPARRDDILWKEIAHAPKNDNEFLMQEHYKDYGSPLFFGGATTHHNGPGGSNSCLSSEDHHSSTASEEEFLEKEFAEEYEQARTQRLQSMTKAELVEEVLCLEAKLEERERELLEFKETRVPEKPL